ncbi:MAG: 16S rRNA (guanine(527)-N(7))-methyltransferase RsmG [Rhodothermaceae bacterium]|nr:16S rRNA (guanine(527)-N(7))-methyltransferase RsmG [Rhodothermaceae bacterium]MYI84679.1 16S rRNA (guanine(527)-N(7))-methyltransferase RsmG [Rhodothermaceae bacterium]
MGTEMFHVKQLYLGLETQQREKLFAFAQLLQQYNRRLNLVSRRTTDRGFLRHIQECLALAAYRFEKGSSLVDWGTGGGLPAIPLAIVFPEVTVYAVDAVQKKIFAINSFKRQLDLPNLQPWHGRAGSFVHKINNSVSRATASLSTLWGWHERAAIQDRNEFGALYCLKGGDLSAELEALRKANSSVQAKIKPVPETTRVVVQVRQLRPQDDTGLRGRT